MNADIAIVLGIGWPTAIALMIVAFLVGAVAIVDAIIMFMPITIIQGHDRDTTPEPWKTVLRMVEGVIGAAFIAWGIVVLVSPK